MANLSAISFATCNLYNLNEPGESIYTNSKGWSDDQYKAKIEWLSRNIAYLKADVWGFQELWHRDSLDRVFSESGLEAEYDLIAPTDHRGKIICAGAVRKGLLVGTPEWIKSFPDELVLQSTGDDPQSPDIQVNLDGFSRPVLHFEIKPRDDRGAISIYVCHFKSKMPTKVYREKWYKADADKYKPHNEGIGAALSTVRRTAEAAALRVILTKQMKGNEKQVVVLGDLNDSQNSNTLNVVTGQPHYLSPLSKGGGDIDLYSAGTLQEYRSMRDVYYTHIHDGLKESLDHILVSQEFYDNSRKRIWAFDRMDVWNDHLNRDDHRISGTSDHAIVWSTFAYRPV